MYKSVLASWVLLSTANAAELPANTQATVDLKLVLAVDVSSSIKPWDFTLQRKGYEDAFLNLDVVGALTSGPTGCAAVTLVYWAVAQRQTIAWHTICNVADARRFSVFVSQARRPFFGGTALANAMFFCGALLHNPLIVAERKVLDVSGDGSDNTGGNPAQVRDALVEQGVTINGLPIVNINEPSVAAFYENNVIGGFGSFMEVAKSFDTFRDALFRKLIRETVYNAPRIRKTPAL